ncbi:MAG TPA: hypothetical protein DDZ51_22410 [Planctomycetaceae bacterium]|nr:hypothetical protein [Planctomycetaceae bacterium]
MQYDDFLDRTIYPGVETVYRQFAGRETLSHWGESPMPAPDWSAGQQVGDFVIESILGAGVTSTVYRVTEATTGKKLALKLLRVRDQESLTTSRLGHRRVLPLLHPSLVRIHGMHMLEGIPAIAMEWVDGITLSELIRSIGGDRVLAFRVAARLAVDIGGALQMLHGSGLVHRDIKPDNLLIESNGRIRLIDYGLVGSYDPEADPDARRGYLAGSFWYMAPESICSQRYPPACDIYALGCVLLELVADPSRLPEPQLGMSLGETVGDIDRVIPVDTPEELRELIRDMLDPNSENRPLAASVARIGSGQPVSRFDTQIAFRPTDLLGRAPEMDAAEKWFHDVARHGTGWLHIRGVNGCGKSWFASELRKRVSSNRWFQVFDASCLTAPRKGFCTFDEIVDIVARRYARDDRGLIELSPAAAHSMLWLFPALRSIVDPKHLVWDVDHCRLPPPDRFAATDSSADMLTGMTEFFNRLCEYGPVMLVLDNFQWIDRSSVDVLNRLLSEVKGSLGLVTVSRNESTPLYCKPDKTISLDPLDERQSVRLIENMIGFGVPKISPRLVQIVARSGRGNANELCQLLVELASEMNDKNFDASFGSYAADAHRESKNRNVSPSHFVTAAQTGKRICVSFVQRLIRSLSLGR